VSTPAPALTASPEVGDLALLRAYEPIVRYNEGELFFPAAVEGYFAECDLLMGTSERDRRVVVAKGEVTADVLATFVAAPDQSLYLRLVQEPLGGGEFSRWQNRPDRPRFKAPGRLARVGLFGRLVDAGFDASLLLRGTVPGGTAAAAQVKYARARAQDPRLVYYGRVVRRNGWIVLHYLYFYFMNDYRSTFSGVNDHEADWEQVFVYLEDAPTGIRPVWVAAAAHDYVGDQLRRRWDDPWLVKEGDHPVLFAGAGSHAKYFEQGEYLTTVPLPALRGVTGLLQAAREFWVGSLHQPDPGDLGARLQAALSASFVDYARGDGARVGHGGASAWSPIVISEDDTWVAGYRGLFGLDTHDRFGGERSPAGPRFTRTGEQRLSWRDPLGFAGLDKTAPPFRRSQALGQREVELQAERAEQQARIDDLVRSLPGADLEVQELALDGGLASLHSSRRQHLAQGELELRGLRASQAAIDDQLVATRRAIQRVETGDVGDPRAHLRRPHRPLPPESARQGLLVEIWSAVSVALLLGVVAGLIWFDIVPWWVAVALALAGYVVAEAAFRRRLTELLLRLTVLLAAITVLVILWQYWIQAILLLVIGLALLLLVDNIREVRRR
jgi:hypothetical protein